MKTENITARFTKIEHEMIIEMAEQRGEKISQLVHDAVMIYLLTDNEYNDIWVRAVRIIGDSIQNVQVAVESITEVGIGILELARIRNEQGKD